MGRATWVAAALSTVVVTACSAGGAEPTASDRSARSSSAPTTTRPTPPPDPCTLTVAGTAVPLTADEAVAATDLAARATRAAGDGPADVQVVARGLGAVGPLSSRADASARALLGHAGPALTCTYPRGTEDPTKLGRRALTPRANALLDAMNGAFGRLPTGGYAAGGVDSGHVEDSSHYDGRAIDVFFRPRQAETQQRRGWTLAQWLVARGDRTSLLSVIYRDRIWTVWASGAGWRDYVHPSGDTEDPVLRHLDHVHTAVVGQRRR